MLLVYKQSSRNFMGLAAHKILVAPDPYQTFEMSDYALLLPTF